MSIQTNQTLILCLIQRLLNLLNYYEPCNPPLHHLANAYSERLIF